MPLPRSILVVAALALGAVLASVPACAPASSGAGSGEGVGANDSQVTGAIPAGSTLVATADVNLRTGPSTSDGVIDVVPSGASVTVVVAVPESGYYDVRYGSEVGWSSGRYYRIGSLATTSGSGGSSATGAGGSGGTGGGAASSASSSSSAGSSSSGAAVTTMVATADVNLRSGPGTSYGILEVVPSGSTVTLLAAAEDSGFYNVDYQGQDGWCSASYLEASSSGTGGGATTWSCTGEYGTEPMANGQYYATEFGCYVDANGNPQQDPGDNCIPACLSQAQTSGLCPGMSGPDCEDQVAWYAADGARFGCLARLLVTNPANGKAVVVVALDYGPACSVEATVSHAAIDLSYPADDYLFGGETGISDEAIVLVDVVDATTPLGPAQ